MSRNQQIEEEGVKSLKQKIDIREMGTRSKIRVSREHVVRMAQQIESTAKEEEMEWKEGTNRKIQPRNTLMATIQEQLRYSPKTKQNKELYEQLLGMVNGILVDQSEEMVKSVVDEVIFCGKNEVSIKSLF